MYSYVQQQIKQSINSHFYVVYITLEVAVCLTDESVFQVN